MLGVPWPGEDEGTGESRHTALEGEAREGATGWPIRRVDCLKSQEKGAEGVQ